MLKFWLLLIQDNFSLGTPGQDLRKNDIERFLKLSILIFATENSLLLMSLFGLGTSESNFLAILAGFGTRTAEGSSSPNDCLNGLNRLGWTGGPFTTTVPRL